MMPFQDLFTPLDKDYCVLFYWISVVNFIAILFASFVFIGAIVMFVKNRANFFNVFYAFLMIFLYGLMYYQARILYSMCVTGNMKPGSYTTGATDSLPAVAQSASMAAPGSLRM